MSQALFPPDVRGNILGGMAVRPTRTVTVDVDRTAVSEPERIPLGRSDAPGAGGRA